MVPVSQQFMKALSCPPLLPPEVCANKHCLRSLRNVDLLSGSPKKENVEKYFRASKRLAIAVSVMIF